MSIEHQAQAALEKQQKEKYQYKYTELEKSTWINGYVRGCIDMKEQELKEIQQPGGSREDGL